MFKFNLGDEVKDIVSGYKGIIECRTEWLNGCRRYSLRQAVGKDGKLPELHTFDQEQLQLVKAGKISVSQKPTGGGRADPETRYQPTR